MNKHKYSLLFIWLLISSIHSATAQNLSFQVGFRNELIISDLPIEQQYRDSFWQSLADMWINQAGYSSGLSIDYRRFGVQSSLLYQRNSFTIEDTESKFNKQKISFSNSFLYNFATNPGGEKFLLGIEFQLSAPLNSGQDQAVLNNINNEIDTKYSSYYSYQPELQQDLHNNASDTYNSIFNNNFNYFILIGFKLSESFSEGFILKNIYLEVGYSPITKTAVIEISRAFKIRHSFNLKRPVYIHEYND